MSDDFEFPKARDFLADARKDFPQFYLLASQEDEALMNGLVLAHAAIVVGMNAPRAGVVPEVRKSLEQITDATERLFTALREAVRTCPTFQRVTEDERYAIEKVAFQVRVSDRESLTPMGRRREGVGGCGAWSSLLRQTLEFYLIAILGK